MANTTRITKDQLIEALRLRYDYYSSTTMFELARGRAGLPDQAAYDAAQVQALRGGLEGIGDRLDAVDARLEVLLGEPAAPAAPASAPAPAPVAPVSAATLEPADVIEADAPSGKDASAKVRGSAKDDADEQAASAAAKVDGPPRRPSAPDVKASKRAKGDPSEKDDGDREDDGAKGAKEADDGDGKSAGTGGKAARRVGGGPPIDVSLVLTGVKVGKGVEVLVCGGTDLLGDWDAAHAVALTKTDDGWATSIKVPLGTELEFKFLQRRADGEVVWERGDNRAVVAEERVECEWR